MEHEHIWEKIKEDDYGEMDYSSYRSGVERFVVTLLRCRICGELKKDYHGDICGNPEEYLRITDADRRYVK